MVQLVGRSGRRGATVLLVAAAAAGASSLGPVSAAQAATPSPSADLSISMSAPEKVEAGTSFPIGGYIRNFGPSTATDAIIVWTVPEGMRILDAGVGMPYKFRHDRRSINVSVSSLKSGARVPVGMTVTSDRWIAGLATTSGATWSFQTADPDLTNNKAKLLTEITPPRSRG